MRSLIDAQIISMTTTTIAVQQPRGKTVQRTSAKRALGPQTTNWLGPLLANLAENSRTRNGHPRFLRGVTPPLPPQWGGTPSLRANRPGVQTSGEIIGVRDWAERTKREPATRSPACNQGGGHVGVRAALTFSPYLPRLPDPSFAMLSFQQLITLLLIGPAWVAVPRSRFARVCPAADIPLPCELPSL